MERAAGRLSVGEFTDLLTGGGAGKFYQRGHLQMASRREPHLARKFLSNLPHEYFLVGECSDLGMVFCARSLCALWPPLFVSLPRG